METVHTVEEWKLMVQPVLESKVNELKELGFRDVSEEDVWQCLIEKVWKGNPTKRIHEIVQDIFQLKSSVYLSFITVRTYQEDDNNLFASIAAVIENTQD